MSRTLTMIAVFGLGIAVALIGAAAILGGGRMLMPDMGDPGPQTSRQLAWQGGDRIEIDVPATVHLMPGGRAQVTLRGPQHVLERIQLHDGVLDAPGSGLFGRSGPVDVTLSGITLRDIALSGSGKILLGHVDQDKLSVSISGSGDIEGEGRVDSASLQISGSGRARLAQLAAKKADIEISGSGKIEIAASDDADVTISGSGTVRFPTTPKNLSTQISGSGHVVNGTAKDSDDD